VAGENLLRSRLCKFLEEHPAGASSDVLAREALGLAGAVGPVADKVVAAAADGDARISQRSNGLWALGEPGERRIRDTPFAAIALKTEGDGAFRTVREAAAVRFSLDGESMVYTSSLEESTSGSAYDSLADFIGDAVPVAFRLPGVRRSLDRWRASMGGRWQPEVGLCLFRMGRSRFPDAVIPDLSALAEAGGWAHMAGQATGDVARQKADLATYLLEAYLEGGVATVDEVLLNLHPDPEPVHFDSYAFDEAYLNELPEAPGIYLMRDRDSTVIYVGKSVNLRSRVGTYFARKDARPEKTQRILDRIWSVEIEVVGSELEALLLEHRLIQLCKPEFNVQAEVHAGEPGRIAGKRVILVLPSADPEGVELFCLRTGTLEQIHARRDHSNWSDVEGSLEDLYFARRSVAPSPPEALEIVRRWATRRKDSVNVVDVEGNTKEEVVRLVRDTMEACKGEVWEKVWQV